MKGDLKTYSFDNVVVIVDGVRIEGFWEGDDAVTVEDSSDITTSSVGAGGEVITSVSTDQSATIKVKLQATSTGHAKMSALHKHFKESGGKIFNVGVNDIGTGEGTYASNCVMQTAPSKGLGQSASMREWTIFSARSLPNTVQYNGL